MPFFHFSQNNSGGSFIQDLSAGITQHVVIEANDYQHANARAEEIGLYFDGCDSGRDCRCCGDRWSEAQDYEKGDEIPMVYDTPALSHASFWVENSVAIHYLNGEVVIGGTTTNCPF